MTTSTMQPHQAKAPSMLSRVSTASNVSHYSYNQAGVSYNQHAFSYNYTSFRGNMAQHVSSAPQMKGR